MGTSRDRELTNSPPDQRPQEAQQPRILALLTFRNEMWFLPSYFENVAPHVDGIIALDDGSTDGSAQFVASQASVLELLRKPVTEPHVCDDGENHRLLVEAAWRYDPDWLIGVDADERLERGFRGRALREIERAEREGYLAYSVVLRELWDRPDTYRADDLWGRKRGARFFKAWHDHEFDDRVLHSHWAPLNSRRNRTFPKADLVIYHLRMIHQGDRWTRQARYKRLDPEKRWQAIGYDYMTDEENLHLEKLPPGREYEPFVAPPAEEQDSATDVLPELEPHKPAPLLACVVISLRNQPGLVAAVQSVLAQNRPLEIVVVNSGGGDPAGTLHDAGIEVKVINLQERLYAGAARNVGISATRAPYVAFLAADCVAEPGWAAGRLRWHRAGALAVASSVTNAYPNSISAQASYLYLFYRRMPKTPLDRCVLYGVSYNRQLFKYFGCFREDLRIGEDTEFNARFAQKIPVIWAPEVRTAHRHPTRITSMLGDMFRRGSQTAQILEQLLGESHQGRIARDTLYSLGWCLQLTWTATPWKERYRLVLAGRCHKLG